MTIEFPGSLGKTLAALLLACAASVHAAPTMNAAAETLIYEGHLLVQQGKLTEAMNKFAEAAKADPSSSMPYSSAAQTLKSLLQVARPEGVAKLRAQAEGYARQALRISADDPVAQEVLRQLEEDKPLPLREPSPQALAENHEGELLFAARKFDEALVHYERAARLDPASSLAWIWAGDCFFARQQWAEAEARFRKGVEVEPVNAQGWRFLADALMAQGKRSAAEEALLNAIAAQPSQRPNWDKLAQMRKAAGFPLTSLQLVRKASVTLDPATNKPTVQLDPSFAGEAGKNSPDGAVWLAFGVAEANLRAKNAADKVNASPFAVQLAAWQVALKVADELAHELAHELAAGGAGALTDPGLKNMVMLNQAGQLEAALLLLTYRESYRAEWEAWKRDHPQGLRKFVDTYGLQP